MYKAVIVDDERVIVDGLIDAVDWEAYGFEIGYAATSSLDALQYMRSNEVNLLITDVSMPEMDGLELLKQAKLLYPQLSIIVVSAFDRFDYVKTALRCGAENYLLKPVDSDELAESLSQIAGHMQERPDLIGKQEYPMLSFRSNLTERWVKNTISSEELMDKASVLGIDLEASDFTVVIFKVNDNADVSMPRLYDLVLTHLTGKLYGHFFFENLATLVCVLSRSKQQSYSVEHFVHDVLAIAQKESLNVFVTAGGTVSSCGEVNKSYLQARSYLFMSCSPEKCIVHHNIYLDPHIQKLLLPLNASLEKENFDCLHPIHQIFAAARTDALKARIYAIVIASCFLQHLGKNVNDILALFPQLKQTLEDFPMKQEASAFEKWVLVLAQQCSDMKSNIQSAMYPCVTAAIKSIHSFSDKDISLKCLAAKLNVTPAYLGALFKKQTGVYFNDYLVNARLEYARNLVLTTDMKMSDIAEKAGFASQTYFNRNFKRAYGASPVVYRREKKLDTEQKPIIPG